MASPERLAELRRQRALVQQHVDWLDAQIAAENAGQPAAPALESGQAVARGPVAPPPAEPGAGGVDLGAPAAAADEAIPAEYRVSSTDLQRDVRRGCFLYFAAALLLLGLGVAGLYLVFRRH